MPIVKLMDEVILICVVKCLDPFSTRLLCKGFLRAFPPICWLGWWPDTKRLGVNEGGYFSEGPFHPRHRHHRNHHRNHQRNPHPETTRT